MTLDEAIDILIGDRFERGILSRDERDEVIRLVNSGVTGRVMSQAERDEIRRRAFDLNRL
jgi:hypothetical protein